MDWRCGRVLHAGGEFVTKQVEVVKETLRPQA